ncbi:MAG: hypothetical protein ABI759_19290 [Candidatus Solibacter sp.]
MEIPADVTERGVRDLSGYRTAVIRPVPGTFSQLRLEDALIDPPARMKWQGLMHRNLTRSLRAL